MTFTSFEIYKYSIPMHPFTIATGTMHFAQNIFIKAHTSKDLTGVGECSAFPMIAGETQNTCYEMAKDFAQLWKGEDALDIAGRMNELHLFTAYNATIKSAFDMVLYDIASQNANLPLYEFLGGKEKRELETDITVGIESPVQMAEKALDFQQQGFRIIKVKLGKKPTDDIERIKAIRNAVGDKMQLRIDANQGWSFDEAVFALTELGKYNIQFCEQPMRKYNDHLLPALKKISPIAIMADESVFDHHDAERIISADGCSYVNIKFAKSSGIQEAILINEVCEKNNIPCMMGGMLESRVALTAAAHFSTAFNNVQFYDMDTCLMGHKINPVLGGIKYNGYNVELPDSIGIGADVDAEFLNTLEKILV